MKVNGKRIKRRNSKTAKRERKEIWLARVESSPKVSLHRMRNRHEWESRHGALREANKAVTDKYGASEIPAVAPSETN